MISRFFTDEEVKKVSLALDVCQTVIRAIEESFDRGGFPDDETIEKYAALKCEANFYAGALAIMSGVHDPVEFYRKNSSAFFNKGNEPEL